MWGIQWKKLKKQKAVLQQTDGKPQREARGHVTRRMRIDRSR